MRTRRRSLFMRSVIKSYTNRFLINSFENRQRVFFANFEAVGRESVIKIESPVRIK